MPVGGATTVGPLSEETRDRLKEYRDQEGHPNYEAALRSLLDERSESPAEFCHEG